jgi:hypothetical protein
VSRTFDLPYMFIVIFAATADQSSQIASANRRRAIL